VTFIRQFLGISYPKETIAIQTSLGALAASGQLTSGAATIARAIAIESEQLRREFRDVDMK
jgi:hypothetical protein